jgi:hypothetical protein
MAPPRGPNYDGNAGHGQTPVHIYFPKEIDQQVRGAAFLRGKSKTAYIRDAVLDCLARESELVRTGYGSLADEPISA